MLFLVPLILVSGATLFLPFKSIDYAFEDDVFCHLLAERDAHLLITLCQFVDGIRAPQVGLLVATNWGRDPLFLQKCLEGKFVANFQDCLCLGAIQ
jgi:hypothetical protein